MSNKELFETSDHRTTFRKSKQKRFLRRRDAEIFSLTKHKALPEKYQNSVYYKDGASQDSEITITKATQRIKGDRLGREGMVFSNIAGIESTPPTPGGNTSSGDPTAPKCNMIDRFTTQILQRSENLDKHMVAYIEGRMATADAPRDYHEQGVGNIDKKNGSEVITRVRNQASRQPAGLGKIQEIDLGPDSTLRNIARTKIATQHMACTDSNVRSDISDSTLITFVRNGDLRKHKRRRNSEDVNRDRLVEEVLRESKLDLKNDSDGINGANGDEAAADDRIAEEFRKEFMDAIISRNHRRAASTSQAANKKKTKLDEKPRGPKLGGSRSARAAMRARENKLASEKP